MNGVGVSGVVFIWMFFLWPIFAPMVVYSFKGKIDSVNLVYWPLSIILGYVFVALLSVGSDYVSSKFLSGPLDGFVASIGYSLFITIIVPVSVSWLLLKVSAIAKNTTN